MRLCLAEASGEARYLTDMLSSSQVTDFAVDSRHRWVVYAQQVDRTFSEELRWVRLRSGGKPPAFTFEAPYAVRSLVWSPSGDRLAYVITPLESEGRDVLVGTGLDELWMLSLEEGQQERIIPENPDETVDWRWLHWSQDGQYLFGNRFFPDESGPPVLYALDLNTNRLQEVGDDVWVLDQNRRGTLLLQSRNIGEVGEGTQMQLWALDWPTFTTSVSLTPQGWSDADGRWSADGTQIIFASAQSLDAKSHLWLMNSDGGQRQQLTSGTGNEYLPRWLPGDGNDYVLFLRDRHELHLLEIETGETRLVLEKANVDYVPVLVQK